MNKLIKLIILETVIFIILLLLFLFWPKQKSITKVCFEKLVLSEQNESKDCFTIEVAKTQTEQERGLMGRDHLDKDKGMLFIFEKEGNHPFWMKDTLIPLDIVWINQNKEIVFIAENTQPCGKGECPPIDPKQNAMYALEINGGLSNQIGLKVGDEVLIKY